MVQQSLNLEYSNSNEAPLVNSEVYCHSQYYDTYLKIPSYIRKFIRKSTAGYALATTDFGFKLQEALETSGKSLRGCNTQANIHADFDTVDIKEVQNFEDTTRYLSGVKHCGSPWNCPVCSAKLSTIRSIQLDSLLDCGKKNNRFYTMVVLTVQHKAGQDLQYLMKILDDLRSHIQGHRKFRAFKEKYKLRFVDVGLELTMSIKQGEKDFHPHNNFVLDFDENPNLSDFEISMFFYELIKDRAFKKHGITVREPFIQTVKKQIVRQDGVTFLKDVEQVKGGVTATSDFKEEYPTKYGLAEEVTMNMYKNGDINGSFHPFHILDYLRFFELPDETKKLLIGMFREYAISFKGRTLFRFGRNVQDYYDENYGFKVEIKEDNEEIEEGKDVGRVLLEISIEDWQKFRPTDMQVATLLQLPKESMQSYIDEIIKTNEDKYKKRQIKKGGVVKTFNFNNKSISSIEFEYKPPINDEITNQSIELNKKREAEINNLKLLHSSIETDERDNSRDTYQIETILI